jgi:hypothetical protein
VQFKILNAVLDQIATKLELRRYIEENTPDWKSFIFENDSRNNFTFLVQYGSRSNQETKTKIVSGWDFGLELLFWVKGDISRN